MKSGFQIYEIKLLLWNFFSVENLIEKMISVLGLHNWNKIAKTIYGKPPPSIPKIYIPYSFF